MAKSKPKSKGKSKLEIEEEIQDEETPDEEPEEEVVDEDDEEVVDEDAEPFDEEPNMSLDDESEESPEESEDDSDEDEPFDEEEAVSEKARRKGKGKTAADDDEESKPPSRPGLKPRITITTMFFIILNWIAAAAFGYLAYVDTLAHLQFRHRTVVNYVYVWGLPLRDEDQGKMVWSESRPRLRFSSEQLRDAFKKRKGTPFPAKEEIVPVDEPVPLYLAPRDLSDPVLKDIFWALPNPVRTLEDEIDRVKKGLPGDIEKAAKDVLDSQKKEDKNSDEDKRTTLRNVFLPIVWSSEALGKPDDRITNAKGEELDKLFLECVQRRMYYDILAPINLYRPGDLDKSTVEKIADLDGYELSEIKDLLVKRLEAAAGDKVQTEYHLGERWTKEQTSPEAQKRNSVEKRQQIAFIIFTLGQLEVPKLRSKLYAKGVERAQTVCGIREFTSAGIAYVRTLRKLEERLTQAIVNYRQGYTVDTKDGVGRTTGKIDIHSAEIDRMVKLVETIEKQQQSLEHLQSQRDDFEKIYKKRVGQHQEVVKKLIAARKRTVDYIERLREKQDELHVALVELSDAADRNFELEAQIRERVLSLQPKEKKGGKKQP